MLMRNLYCGKEMSQHHLPDYEPHNYQTCYDYSKYNGS